MLSVKIGDRQHNLKKLPLPLWERARVRGIIITDTHEGNSLEIV